MEQFAKLPRAVQFVLTLVLGAALLGGSYWGVISNQRQKLAALKTKSDGLDSQIRQGKEAKRRTEEIQRQIDMIKRQLDLVVSIIPVEPETGKLLRVFQSFARDQNLAISAISPKGISKKELYSEQAYDVEVAGGYHDLAMFMDKLAHMRRIVNVGSLEVKSATGKGAATVNAKFQSIVYMQNPEAFAGLEKKP